MSGNRTMGRLKSMSRKNENMKRRFPNISSRVLSCVRYGYMLPALVLFIGLVTTYVVWLDTRQEIDGELQRIFDTRTNEAVDLLRARMTANEQILRGVEGLFASGTQIGRAEFRVYVSKLKLEKMYHGIQAVGFAQLVPASLKKRHIADVRKEGFPEYDIRPAGTRDLYTSSVYLEPFSGRNLRAFGFDMYSEPVLQAAMDKAVESNDAAMSGSVTLIQESGAPQAGFMLYLPVYKNGTVPDTMTSRRSNLRGWAYSAFRMGDLMTGLYDERSGNPDIRIYDGSSVSEPALIYSFGNWESTSTLFQVTKTINFAEHNWKVRFKAPSGFERTISRGELNFIAIMGAATSLLMALLAWVFTQSRKMAIQAAREMTSELDESKKELQNTVRELQFMQRVLDEHAVVSITDAAGNITHANQKFIEISGYSREELIGNNHRLLKSGVHPAEFYLEMWDTLIRGQIWHGKICNRGKHGRLYWMDSTVMPLLDESGLPVRYVSVRTDITKLKESMDRWVFAVEGAGDGIWDWNMLTGAMPLSGFYESMLGYVQGELTQTIEAWVKSVHPDDLSRIQADLQDYLTGVSPVYAVELRLRCKDGHYKWVLCRGHVVERDTGGKPVRMIGIHSDIDHRKHIEEMLLKAKEEAERANRAKSDFLSSMSHELRTPMNAVLGFAQLLQYSDALTDDQQDNVHEILKAGNHLLELINEVLDLAKIESGHIELSLEPVELAGIIEECFELLANSAEKLGIQTSCSGESEVNVWADRTRLRQILLNLLSNAIKYNRSGGSVTVLVHHEGSDRVRISVTDTGKGIASEKIAMLFQPFNRLDAENSNIEGTGIGLTITKRLVDAMRGAAGVESEVGVGSSFWIELPLATAHTHHQEQTSFDGTVLAQSIESTQHIVLYIEDNPSNIKLVSNILELRKNIRLLTAHTPELGIEMALAHHPALILLDINMPGMDGYQVLEVVKADASMNATPIIAVTANAMPRDIEQGKVAGFAEYLTKPLNISYFLTTLDRLLAKAEK